jgi:hypothetical protein
MLRLATRISPRWLLLLKLPGLLRRSRARARSPCSRQPTPHSKSCQLAPVIPGAYDSVRLGKAASKQFGIKSAQGSDVVFNLNKGVVVSGATVTTPDLKASNGVIHVIDTVMLPKSVKAAMKFQEMKAKAAEKAAAMKVKATEAAAAAKAKATELADKAKAAAGAAASSATPAPAKKP